MPVFHIHHDMDLADEVVDKLLAAGIGRRHISVLTSEATGARQLSLRQGTRAAERGGTGASVGGAAGLIAGTLVTAATAGVGILAAGPLFTGFAAMRIGGLAGGLGGALVGTGIPEAEAKFYAQEIKEKDAILIGVDVVGSERDMVQGILSQTRRTLSIKTVA